MMRLPSKSFSLSTATLCIAFTATSAHAAQGEMGTGVPHFGLYTAAQGWVGANVWRLDDASIQFPAGCTNLSLSSTGMGMDSYKIAVAILTAAKVAGRRVRFYAHAPRDSGCGVDYVELI